MAFSSLKTAWPYGNGKSDGLLGEMISRNQGKRLYAASKILASEPQVAGLTTGQVPRCLSRGARFQARQDDPGKTENQHARALRSSSTRVNLPISYTRGRAC